ncbi:MAG: amidohydrolase family protein [Pseudomonadota bacterium]
MNLQAPLDATVPNVLAPRALVADAASFGGEARGDCLFGDLILRGGRAVSLASPSGGGGARIVTPRLTEAHVHLDKCHTVHRMGDVGGDLAEAIAKQAEDRAAWTAADLRARAARGLDELSAAGCGAVRSHVDWDANEAGDPPLAWGVLRDLAAERRGQIDLQLAPLTGVEQVLDPRMGEAIARLTGEVGGALGVFLFDQPDRRDAILAAIRLAEAHGLPLDFHVDEGLADGLDGLRLIAEAVIETGFAGPVLCGHACSLANLEGEALARTIDLVARSGVAVAALPSTNLYLQGRGAGAPDRRGLTRVRELRAAGVPVVAGTDNVRDAFCPLGRHDPLTSLSLAALAAHLDPPYGDWLPMVSVAAEAAMGLAVTHIDGARPENLIIWEAETTADLIAAPPAPTPLTNLLGAVAR